MDPRSKITAPVPGVDLSRPQKSTLAYGALLLFTVIYFLRPEDYIPGLHYIPIGKITGGIALLALIFRVGAQNRPKLPVELKILLLLLVQMIATIPFAYWRGGSFDVVVNFFSKGVIVGLLVFFSVANLKELRRLLYVQSALVALLTVVSLLVYRTKGGRLMGLQKGFLENSNDLAINIAINFPLCVAFMLAAKGIRKALWGVGLAFMMYGVVATYSRSGMVALFITGLICLWEFGIKGRRISLLVGAALIGMIGAGVMLAQPHYLQRLETLVRGGDVEGAADKGSLEARSNLLKAAISLTFHHPVFGVGPGNFPVVTDKWVVVHNTYAELGAETGFPGLILFLLMLGFSFRRLKRVRELPGYKSDPDLAVWTAALWGALAAYALGSLFASTEYNLFPYFIIGYICALYNITGRSVEVPGGGRGVVGRGSKERGRDANERRQLAWTR
jgi:O-antigen ligase